MKKTIAFLLVLVILLMTPLTALAAKPKFTVLSVTPEKSVTLSAEGLPAHQSFEVYMGRAGTRGVSGEYVGSTSTNGLGRFLTTFNIPLQLSKDYQIDVFLVGTAKDGKTKIKYYTNFINRSQPSGVSFLKINPTRNVTLEVRNLKDDARYHVWMSAGLNTTPYRAALFKVAKGKSAISVQVPIPVKLRGEPSLYVYIVDALGYVVAQGYFYNR